MAYVSLTHETEQPMYEELEERAGGDSSLGQRVAFAFRASGFRADCLPFSRVVPATHCSCVGQMSVGGDS